MEGGEVAAAGTNPLGREASDGQILEALFDRYEQRIFNLIYRLVGDYEDAADLTADTFLHAVRSFARFRGEAQPYTWLYRIAVNLCKNHYRRTRYRARFHAFSLDAPAESEDGAPARQIQDRHQEPALQAEAHQLQQELHAALQSLRPDFRLVLVLKELEGLSYAEIAQLTGCTHKAVKSRLFRARAALRARLAHHLRAAE